MLDINVLNYNKPIPASRPMDGWKGNVIDETAPEFNEPLVPVGPLSDYPEIASNGVYFGERESAYGPGELEGSLLTSFMRKTVAEKLVEASKRLPPRCVLMTLDTLRTEAVQTSLFENFKNELTRAPFHLAEEEAAERTQQYVSQPSRPNSPHLTGGAVDLTIVEFTNDRAWQEYCDLTQKLKEVIAGGKREEKSGEIEDIERQRSQLLREQTKMLDMGVAFDQVALDEKGRDKTALRYYENKLEKDGFLPSEDFEPLKNRRLLYNVLTPVGFTFYPDEPWHADIYNKFWAQQSGQNARYGFIEPSKENWQHEQKRRELFACETFIQDDYRASPDYAKEMKLATARIGNPQYSKNNPSRFAYCIRPARPTDTSCCPSG